MPSSWQGQAGLQDAHGCTCQAWSKAGCCFLAGAGHRPGLEQRLGKGEREAPLFLLLLLGAFPTWLFVPTGDRSDVPNITLNTAVHWPHPHPQGILPHFVLICLAIWGASVQVLCFQNEPRSPATAQASPGCRRGPVCSCQAGADPCQESGSCICWLLSGQAGWEVSWPRSPGSREMCRDCFSWGQQSWELCWGQLLP